MTGLFQSTPRFVGEGNRNTATACSITLYDDAPTVSIHPPLCRRGEHCPLRPARREACRWRTFQSTPRFVGEGNAGRSHTRRWNGSVDGGVSIHPPLCRRGGTTSFVQVKSIEFWFQSTPALSARGTIEPDPMYQGAATARGCSIHPPHCRRGEPRVGYVMPKSKLGRVSL